MNARFPEMLERPDEHEAGAAGEQYCFMPGNNHRECNAACVAYDGRYVSDDRLSPCTVLNTMKSVGISLGLMASSGRLAAKQAQVSTQPAPPEVK